MAVLKIENDREINWNELHERMKRTDYYVQGVDSHMMYMIDFINDKTQTIEKREHCLNHLPYYAAVIVKDMLDGEVRPLPDKLPGYGLRFNRQD